MSWNWIAEPNSLPTLDPHWAPEETEMPELSRFYGIIIKIYWDDHGRPHFHAFYSGDGAVFDIETLEKLDGYLPPQAAKLVLKWAKWHQDDLMYNWDLAKANRPLEPIPGLDE